MANIYPLELSDIESTSDCIRNTVADWTYGDLNDKRMAIFMEGHCSLLKKSINDFKDAYRREAKMILELTGEEVAT